MASVSDYFATLVDDPDLKHIRAVRAGLSAYNIEKMPELLNLPDDDLAIFLRDQHGTIQGGVVAEIDWGVLYVDLLWVNTDLRGKQYGKALMHTIEQTAHKQGIRHVYLMTTEFQALSFYQHMGYELFGTLINRPHGYNYYYLRKMNLQPSNLTHDLPVTIDPDQSDVQTVNHGLRHYCEQFVDCTSQQLTAFIYRADGEVMGGITGSTYWDWYDLHFFWVSAELRGQGYGKQLLHLAEAECHRRGIIGIACDTANFQALPFYQSQGFEIFATLPDRPPKHESYFLKKLLR